MHPPTADFRSQGCDAPHEAQIDHPNPQSRRSQQISLVDGRRVVLSAGAQHQQGVKFFRVERHAGGWG